MEKKLYRIPAQGSIAGVCAGIAEYFKADVSLVRILAVIAVFATDGAFVIIYFILALALPVKNRVVSDTSIGERVQSLASEVSEKNETNNLQNWAGLALIVMGLWLTLSVLSPAMFMLRWDIVWALVLVGIGVAILMKGRSSNE